MAQRHDTTLRSAYIDVLKGIGICLVILGHMIPRGSLWNLIYGVHMPLFLFCAGMFEKDTLRLPRLLRLSVYYVAMAAVGTGVYFLLYKSGDMAYIKQTIFNILIGGPSSKHGIWPVEALWFLPSLILITILYHLLHRIPVPMVRHLCVIAVALLGAVLVPYRDTVTMYYSFDVSLLLFPFFYLGSSIRSMAPGMAMMRSSKLLTLAALTGVAYAFIAQSNGEINIYRGLWGQYLTVYYLEAMIGLVALLALSILIQRYTKFVSGMMMGLGKHTLIMMGTHQLFILLLQDLFPSKILLFPTIVLVAWSVSYGYSSLTKRAHERSMMRT